MKLSSALLVVLLQMAMVSSSYAGNIESDAIRVMVSKMEARGIAANDPRFDATVTSIGAAIGGMAAGAGSAPLWVSVALSVGVGVAISLAVDGLIKWINNGDGTVTSSSTVPANYATLAEGYDAYCGIMATGPDSSGRVCTSSAAALRAHGFNGMKKSDGDCYEQYESIGCVYPSRMEADGYAHDYSWSFVRTRVTSSLPCPVSLNGVCDAPRISDPTTTTSTPKNLANGLSPSELAQPANPELLAKVLDHAWKTAASTAGYKGIPYQYADPVTTSDVTSISPSSTVGDYMSPVNLGGGGAESGSLGEGVTLGGSPKTQPQTVAPSSPAETKMDLGPDPGIGSPSLDSIPTGEQILHPILDLVPGFRSFAVPQHIAECIPASFDFFGHQVEMSSHCLIAEKIRPFLAALMSFAWLAIAARIILSA